MSWFDKLFNALQIGVCVALASYLLYLFLDWVLTWAATLP